MVQYIVLPHFMHMEDPGAPDLTDTGGDPGEGALDQGLGPGDRDTWWQEEEPEE